MFKKGEILVAKRNSIYSYKDCLTERKQYKIEKVLNLTLVITDDDHKKWYLVCVEDDAYYYGNFFYTKKELRDIKLKEIGIY